MILNHVVVPVSARKENEESTSTEVFIGALMALTFLILGVSMVLLFLNRRHKLQGSPSAFLRNPFGVSINMKVTKNTLEKSRVKFYILFPQVKEGGDFSLFSYEM